MRIAICDDSPKDASTLRELCIGAGESNTNTCDVFSSGNELCEAYNTARLYDLVLLDVDMPGLNGIQTGKLIRDIDPNVVIVFITSYPQYALEAFECEAFNYLLKPCTKEKLYDLLTRVQAKLRTHTLYHLIKTKGKTIRIPISDIYYVECLNKHVYYHTASGIYDTVGRIGDAYNALRDLDFVQIHQGYIVNMDKIADFDKQSVTLDNGARVEMSVRRRKEALKTYAEFLERYI